MYLLATKTDSAFSSDCMSDSIGMDVPPVSL